MKIIYKGKLKRKQRFIVQSIRLQKKMKVILITLQMAQKKVILTIQSLLKNEILSQGILADIVQKVGRVQQVAKKRRNHLQRQMSNNYQMLLQTMIKIQINLHPKNLQNHLKLCLWNHKILKNQI